MEGPHRGGTGKTWHTRKIGYSIALRGWVCRVGLDSACAPHQRVKREGGALGQVALAHHASEAVGGELRPEEESSASPLCGLKTPPPPSQRGHLFLVGAEAGALSGHLDVGMAAPGEAGRKCEGFWRGRLGCRTLRRKLG